ncbi:hypothetical protein EUGRSUZ_L03418 [Eucalyptus grandis]|uniref:TFIIE beta domain-containing protein n=1 Tax=Eucalyptus grandis TaxID=71139 RepID=A0AAD9T8J2_EUCGR|nr:hypothetical protein EUGRSUZ_L03418 [Eucalyptus grandis]
MALQEQLNKFKKQPEKCQSTLTSIVARAGSTSTPAMPMPAPPFSDDTERLKNITGIRKAPVGAQMKHVIDLLYESRLALTPEQINEPCYVDMLSNKAVFDNLANNPKVYYDGQQFSYESKHDLKDKNKLLKLIRSYMEGIKVIDLKDAYPTVMEDLQDIAYPNDPKVPIKVDDDLKQLFRSIELPRDMIDIENDLQKSTMKASTNTMQRRLAAQIHGISQKPKLKKKKHEISKRTKLTNVHLPELFENLRGS